MNERLHQQIQFLLEADRLKSVIRRNFLADDSRRENTAEHSWHIILMAQVLFEYHQQPGVDLLQVLRLLCVHDLVEIYAGDTFFFDETGNQDKFQRESMASARLFGLLPPDQAAEFRGLWEEFEAAETPSALFALAVDRIAPVLLNSASSGTSWKEAGIRADQVREKMKNIPQASGALGDLLEELVKKSVEKGSLLP